LLRWRTSRISNTIANAAREAGTEIPTEVHIAKIIVENEQARGVAFENGDEVRAHVVASSVDPRLTFMKMVGSEHLPSDFVEGVRRYKFRGSSAKINLALDGLPTFKNLRREVRVLRG